MYPRPLRPGVKSEPDRIDRVVRHGKTLHGDIADGKLGAGAEESPIAMLIENAVAAHRLGGERITINRDGKFPAKHFEAADVIAMLVGEEDAIELFRRDPALLEAQHELARAQSAIDQNPAMIGRDERAVSGAAAAEHRQTEHCRMISRSGLVHKQKLRCREFFGYATTCMRGRLRGQGKTNDELRTTPEGA